MFIQTKNKKAVSVMIGYILLVTFAIVISVAVYSWLKTYVPKAGIECPNDVSIYISDYTINGNQLNLTFQNNGKFNVGGIYIYYSGDKNQTIASHDLSEKIINSDALKFNPGLKFSSTDDNSFKIGNETVLSFDITNIDKIYAIDIIPIRWQENNNQLQVVSCTNSKTSKILDLTINPETQQTSGSFSLG